MAAEFDPLSSNNFQPDIRWRSLSLTHVEYPEGDLLGKLLAYSSLLPLAVLIGFVTLILFRRDLHTITFFIGLLFNEALNAVLKHIIKQPRPMSRDNMYNEYGMPSSHSQFMWFFSIYMFLFIWVRLQHITNTKTVWFCKTIGSFGCFVTALVVTFSRIYLLYHTVNQVIVGSLIGSLLGLFWFLLTNYVFTPWFQTVASWWLCEWLLIRDQTLIPNVVWFEYTIGRQEMRARSRKLVSMKSQ